MDEYGVRGGNKREKKLKTSGGTEPLLSRLPILTQYPSSSRLKRFITLSLMLHTFTGVSHGNFEPGRAENEE